VTGLPYREGDWFAVPLGGETFALGRIARHHEGIVFAYFFAPAFDHLPSLAEVDDLTASESLTQMLVSHLDLRDGAWPVLGQADDWDPSAWPLVEFERRVDEPRGGAESLYAITWDERTLNQEVSARPLDPSEAGMRPRDVLSGAGAAVVRLRHALGL
jgi:hypothetical protein